MKLIISSFLMFLIAIVAIAQEPTDTIATQQLQEIVIQAPKVIRKADMDVYYPSQSAVDNSKNGVQFLSNLMIPTLTVAEALGTIQAADLAPKHEQPKQAEVVEQDTPQHQPATVVEPPVQATDDKKSMVAEPATPYRRSIDYPTHSTPRSIGL